MNYQTPSGFTRREIETSNNITYVGFSRLGEATSGEWSIIKIEATTTGRISIRHASDSWDNRLTANYR